MNILNVLNLTWANTEQTAINCTLVDDTNVQHPFTASPNDCEKFGQSLYAEIVAGQHGLVANFAAPILSLSQMKAQQQNAIRTAFDADSILPVSALGITWDGGFDSALKLDGAKRLAELAGLSNVTFYSSGNVGYALTIADAAQVVLAVSFAYQTAFARKQEAMVAIDAAATVADVQAITY